MTSAMPLCTSTAKVVGPNPAQSLNFFQLCSSSVAAALALMTVVTQLLLMDKINENLFAYRKMMITNSLKRRVLSIVMFMLADRMLVKRFTKKYQQTWNGKSLAAERNIAFAIPVLMKSQRLQISYRNNIMNMLLMYHKKYWVQLLFKWCYQVNIRSLMLISQWGCKLSLIKLWRENFLINFLPL